MFELKGVMSGASFFSKLLSDSVDLTRILSIPDLMVKNLAAMFAKLYTGETTMNYLQ